MAAIEIHKSGPLFNGHAEIAAARYAEAVEEKLAQEGVNRIHQRLGEVLKVNHGIYESHIHTERQINDLMITDTPIVYGPWLEGTGSRNETTRFKGYHTFRLVSQQLDQDATAIAEGVLHSDGYLREMN